MQLQFPTMFNHNNRYVAALVALAVLLSGVGGVAMAAQPTIDSDDTDGDGTSDITAKYTIVHNDSQETPEYLQYDADSSNSSVSIYGPDGNEVYHNETADTVNSTEGTYRVGIHSVDDFDDLEVGGGENVTLTVEITNNTEASSPDTTNITAYYQNTNSSARLIVDDTDANSDAVEFKELGVRQQIPYFGTDVKPAAVDQTFAIEGQNTTTATFSITNASVQDAFAEAHGDKDSGTWMPESYAQVNDHYVPIFASSDPSADWIDTDEDAYIVASESGDEATMHNMDALVEEGDTEVTVSMTANENMGFMNAKSMFENLDAGVTTWAFQSLKAL